MLNAVIERGSTFQERGLEINTPKSKIMKISRAQDNEELNIKRNETMLEVVEQYSYLGVIITNDGRIDKEISNRIKKANQIYYEINNTVLGKKKVDPKTKIQIYKSFFSIQKVQPGFFSFPNSSPVPIPPELSQFFVFNQQHIPYHVSFQIWVLKQK
jgi:hypothetical protein